MLSIALLMLAHGPAATIADPATASIPATSYADGGAYEEAKAEAGLAFAADLEELAKWCQKNKAYRERDQIYELLLTVQPDHKDARKTLGYTFDRKAEEWVRKREYRQPKRSKPSVTLEAVDKRKQVIEGDVERRIAVLEKHGESLDPATKRAEVRAMLEYAPDHEGLHALIGNVRVPVEGGVDLWVGATAANAILRGRELKTAREKGLTSAGPAEYDEPESQETGLGFVWAHTLRNERMRVLSTGERSEAEQLLSHVSMVWDYLPMVLGGSLEPREDDAIYVLTEDDAAAKFRDNFALVSDDNREYWDVVRGTFLGSTTRMCLVGGGEPARLDMAMRQTIGLYLWRVYGVSGKRGWLTEGIGLYLVHQAVGTRLSMTLNESEYEREDKDYAASLTRDNEDWLALAASMIEKDEAPNLSFVVGKNVGTMTPRDLILSFALAAYLIEGQGVDKTAEILRRVGGDPANGVEGEASAAVLSDVLGLTLPEITPQLLRWLREAHGLGK